MSATLIYSTGHTCGDREGLHSPYYLIILCAAIFLLRGRTWSSFDSQLSTIL